MKYCNYCGMKLRDESRFCYRCGKPCADRAASAPERPELTAEDGMPDAPEPAYAGGSDPEAPGAPAYGNSTGETPEEFTAKDAAFPEGTDPEAADARTPEIMPEPERDQDAAPEASGAAERFLREDTEEEPDPEEAADTESETDEAIDAVDPEDLDEEDAPSEPRRRRALVYSYDEEDDGADFDDEDAGADFDEEDDGDYDDFGEEGPEAAARRKKRGKLRIVLLLLIAAALAAYAVWSPARRTFMYAHAGNADRAVEVYRSEVFPNPVEKTVLSLLAPPGIDSVFDAYNRSDIHFEDAAGRIRTLGQVGNASGTAERKLNQLETLYNSKVSFLTGEKARESGDYRAAMQAYRKVVKEDKNFTAASELADASEEAYVKGILEQVSAPASNEEYEAAIALLEDAQEALPDNREIADALSGIRQKYAASLRSSAMSTASSYIEQGFYKEAIDLVNEALVYNEQDAELITLRNTAVRRYEDFVTEQVDIYLKNKDLDGAVALLEKAASDLPDSRAVAQLYTALKEN